MVYTIGMEKEKEEELYPTSPYSAHEQMCIMRDLQVSLQTAFREDDSERLRQLSSIVIYE